MAKLTQKQERFCLSYIESGNASEAYRQAYVAAKMKPESVNNSAFKLLQSGEITARLAELRKIAADKAVITLDSHLADLKMLRNAAAKDRKWGPAIAAEIARGKHSGVAVEKSQAEVTVKRAIEELTDEELAQEAARHGLKF